MERFAAIRGDHEAGRQERVVLVADGLGGQDQWRPRSEGSFHSPSGKMSVMKAKEHAGLSSEKPA